MGVGSFLGWVWVCERGTPPPPPPCVYFPHDTFPTNLATATDHPPTPRSAHSSAVLPQTLPCGGSPGNALPPPPHRPALAFARVRPRPLRAARLTAPRARLPTTQSSPTTRARIDLYVIGNRLKGAGGAVLGGGAAGRANCSASPGSTKSRELRPKAGPAWATGTRANVATGTHACAWPVSLVPCGLFCIWCAAACKRAARRSQFWAPNDVVATSRGAAERGPSTRLTTPPHAIRAGLGHSPTRVPVATRLNDARARCGRRREASRRCRTSSRHTGNARPWRVPARPPCAFARCNGWPAL